jgi:hypothetical protein
MRLWNGSTGHQDPRVEARVRMPHGTLSDGLWSMRLAIERATGTHGAQGLLGRVRVVCERAGVRLGDGDRPRVGSRVLLQSAPGAAMRTHSRYVRRFHLTARSRGWSLARLSASRVSLPPRMAMTPPRSPAGRPAAILRTATLDDMREIVRRVASEHGRTDTSRTRPSGTWRVTSSSARIEASRYRSATRCGASLRCSSACWIPARRATDTLPSSWCWLDSTV